MNGTKILMHKGDKVASVTFDRSGYLKNLKEVYDERLLPPSAKGTSELEIRVGLERWCLSRSLAFNRRDIAPLREFYGSNSFLSDTGVSLFDCYWFADNDHNDWEEENAFDNWNAKDDLLYTMIAHPDETRASLYRQGSKNSPNFMIPGSLSRIWYSKTDKKGRVIPVLLYEDAKKEVAAYKTGAGTDIIAKRKYVILAGRIFAMVNSQTNKNIEMISFDNYYISTMDREKDKMTNLENACTYWNIPYWKDFFNKYFEIENVVKDDSGKPVWGTEDFSDIGVLRDSETLEIIGFSKM